jgi:WD40 repeat protein
MPDVFISYSRKDQAFVRRLDEGLRQRNREAWVDWEGIRPTEEFMLAIYGSIEKADTFIFVLTPDSVGSKVCHLEIAHAVEHNKRLVPVVHRDVETGEVPEALAKLNWTFCRDSDDFEKGIDTLIQALDTDLEWLHAHTRFLTRAIEWESKGKNSSFVLRGVDLRAAEQWLAEAGSNKERQPTALQTNYILLSRKAATKAQRITLAAVTLGLIVAAVLAVLAFFARRDAVQQEGIAKAKAAETSQTLSKSDFAQGTRLVKEGQATMALAYFARAVRTTGQSAAGTRIVSLLISRVWPLPVSSQRPQKTTNAWFSADGRRMVTLSQDGASAICDGETGQPLSEPIRFKHALKHVSFSPDGSRVLMSFVTPDESVSYLQLWDATKGRALAQPQQHDGRITNASYSRDGRRVVTSDACLLDAETGRQLSKISDPGLTPELPGDETALISPDGGRVVTMADGFAMVWEAKTDKRVRLDVGEIALAICAAFSPDGLRVATATSMEEAPSSDARVWNAITGAPLTEVISGDTYINTVEFSADGRWLLTVGGAQARVYDSATGKPVTKPLKHPSGEGLKFGSFGADGSRIITGAEDGSVCVWNAATGEPATEVLECGNLSNAQFSKDTRYIVTADASETERGVWEAFGGIARPLSLPGRLVARNGSSVLARSDDPLRIRVWDIRNGRMLVESAPLGDRLAFKAGAFSPDGRRVLAVVGDRARIWDVASDKELPLLGKIPGLREAELNADASKMLTLAKAVAIWDAETGKLLHEFKPSKADTTINSAHFNSDGRLMVTASSNGVAQLWDVGTGQAQGPPLRQTGDMGADFDPKGLKVITSSNVNDWRTAALQLWDARTSQPIGSPIRSDRQFDFSPDGLRFLIASGQSLQVLDTATGMPIGPWIRHKGGVADARFSADGRFLAIAGGYVQVWDPIAGRAMTEPVKTQVDIGFNEVEFNATGERLAASGVGGRRPDDPGSFEAVIDATTGAPLIDSKFQDESGGALHFCSDGIHIIEDSSPIRIWNIAPTGEAPKWLADLAEAVGGCRVGDNGVVEVLDNRVETFEQTRKAIADLPQHDDPWEKVGRWFVADPEARSVAPFSE